MRTVAVKQASWSIPATAIMDGFTTSMYDIDRKIRRAPLNSVLTLVPLSVREKKRSRKLLVGIRENTRGMSIN